MPDRCELCQRHFDTKAGLNIHLSHCRRKTAANSAIQEPPAVLPVVVNQTEIGRTTNLPEFAKIDIVPRSSWNEINGHEFAKCISEIYDESVKWRKNLFKLPSGAAAKEFVTELSHWLEHFNRSTEFQGIALKVYMILPSLLLQKPSRNSKSKEHLSKLQERLSQWKSGQLSDLMRECRRI